MNYENRRKQFIEMYKMLCEEYGMYVGAWSSESGMDMGVDIEEICSPDELTTHLKELNP